MGRIKEQGVPGERVTQIAKTEVVFVMGRNKEQGVPGVRSQPLLTTVPTRRLVMIVH